MCNKYGQDDTGSIGLTLLKSRLLQVETNLKHAIYSEQDYLVDAYSEEYDSLIDEMLSYQDYSKQTWQEKLELAKRLIGEEHPNRDFVVRVFDKLSQYVGP